MSATLAQGLGAGTGTFRDGRGLSILLAQSRSVESAVHHEYIRTISTAVLAMLAIGGTAVAANEYLDVRERDLRERIEKVEANVAALTDNVAVLKTDVAVLKTDVAVLKTASDEHGRILRAIAEKIGAEATD